MDTKYDMTRLNFEELLELRELQAKMQDVTAAKVRHRRHELEPEEPEDLARLTLDELLRLERLYLKMANEPYSWERPSVHVGADGKLLYKANGEPYTWDRETVYVPVIPPWYSGEAAAVTKPAEPVAVAPGPAPTNPVAPATPAPAEKPKLPSEDVLSAARQLDALMRFGA